MKAHTGRLRASRRVRAELRRRARSQRGEVRRARRARIVLLSLEGHGVGAVAGRMGIDRAQVDRWTERFRRWGLGGLDDKPRSGRPARITQAERARIVALACRSPEGFGLVQTLWTLDALAQQATAQGLGPLTRSSVHRILQDAELRPHKVKMWCTSNDPDYDRKLADVTRLYLAPPPGEAVVCIDEKSQMQALSRRVGIRRARQGRAGRQESDYARHGTRCLLACFDVRTGKVIGALKEKRRSVEFLAFLDRVAKAYPTGRVHVVLDNLNTHYGPAVDAWNRSQGSRFVFHYTPYHASWLNQIEIFFGILSRRILRHGEFGSVQALEDAVRRFLRRWNRVEAHPFRWTYRAKKKDRLRRVA